MSSEPSDVSRPIVHALLVCRGLDTSAEGEISLQNVVEIVPVDKVPADIGPLTFVAFVRNLPKGPGQGAFVLRSPGREEALGRLPLEMDVPAGLEARQVALQVTVPSLPVASGGWFEVYFEWAGTPLAANRFAVGVKA